MFMTSCKRLRVMWKAQKLEGLVVVYEKQLIYYGYDEEIKSFLQQFGSWT